MPLLKKTTKDSYVVAIWQTTESAEVLRELCHPVYQSELDSSGLKGARLLERAAVRAMLSALIPENTPNILYNSDGRPALENGVGISISHTKGYAAIILSRQHKCGIDIERIEDRAVRVKEKFMNDTELGLFGNQAVDATLCWSAKETVYKITGKEATDFKNKIIITKASNGLKASSNCSVIDVSYELFNDFVITWATISETKQ